MCILRAAGKKGLTVLGSMPFRSGKAFSFLGAALALTLATASIENILADIFLCSSSARPERRASPQVQRCPGKAQRCHRNVLRTASELQACASYNRAECQQSHLRKLGPRERNEILDDSRRAGTVDLNTQEPAQLLEVRRSERRATLLQRKLQDIGLRCVDNGKRKLLIHLLWQHRWRRWPKRRARPITMTRDTLSDRLSIRINDDISCARAGNGLRLHSDNTEVSDPDDIEQVFLHVRPVLRPIS